MSDYTKTRAAYAVAAEETNSVQADTRAWLAKFALPLLLLGCAFVYLFTVARSAITLGGARWFVLNDDVMVSMRYAWQMAHGHGLVWNPGEHVQGYTNLGWTLVLVGIHWLHLPLRVNALVVELVNMALHLALVAYVYTHLRARSGVGLAFFAGLLVAFNVVLFNWATAGMENTLQTLLVTIALLRLLPLTGEGEFLPARLYLAPLCTALAFVVRPDAIVLFVCGSIAAMLAIRTGAQPDKTERKRLLAGIAFGVVIVASVLLWQKVYYGDWLPNTFTQRALGGGRSLSHALTYLRKFAFDDWQIFFLVGSAIYLALGLKNPRTRGSYAGMALIFVGWFAYVVWIGGDVLRHSRYFTAILPLLIVAATQWALSWSGKQQITARRSFLPVCIAIALLVFHLGAFRYILAASKDKLRGNVRDRLVTIAGLERAHLPENSRFALFEQGAIPYFLPQYRFHDLLGNSDAHIAHLPAAPGAPGHNKWDFTYSLGVVKPDYLIGTAGGAQGVPAGNATEQDDFRYFAALSRHPLFLRDYAPNRVRIAVDGEEPKFNKWVYARKERPDAQSQANPAAREDSL